jgi:hypothetical protein
MYFLALGFLLGALYDALRFVRCLIMPPRRRGYVFDALFGCLAAILSFLCLLALNHGRAQWFVLAGELLGAMVYHLSLGGTAAGLRQIALKIRRSVAKPIIFLFRKISDFFARIDAKIRKFLKKTGQNLKKGLHYAHDMRYNSKRSKHPPGEEKKGRATTHANKRNETQEGEFHQKAAQPPVDFGGGGLHFGVGHTHGFPEQQRGGRKKRNRPKTGGAIGAAKAERALRGRAASAKGRGRPSPPD